MWLYFSSGKVKNHLSVEPKDYKYKQVFQLMTETPVYQNCCWWLFLFHNINQIKLQIMKKKKEQLMIIQALGTCIARKNQKSNRRQRLLANAEAEGQTGLHQLRRNVYKGIEEIKEFETLKERLENEFV
jgi:hypothetical protein